MIEIKDEKESSLLRQYSSQLIVVTTDLCEAEFLIKTRAIEAQRLASSKFEGDEPSVYFKFQYVTPCENFGELRRLILEVQGKTGLLASFKGIVALESSQWVGHEREEYFTIMLKYLYDHRNYWQAVLILKDCTQTQLQRFLAACAAYMTPRVVEENIFSNEDKLDEIIRITFSTKGYTLRRASGSLDEELARKFDELFGSE